ncbi:MBL fold metallo-hydrolase [Aquiluna sp.]|jgi:L-ascorbate metabolism protein UlaG (beta-lactamase superfamily)|nr:MBL fold metallo-hydrolase [Aquiluna sp.]MDB4018407.1 MBL fold metallo-hydrolase [Aquiluna sp.]
MKITKYEHAFLSIELERKSVLIDPGSYSPTLPEISNVVAICLTHVHDDHSYIEHIQKLLRKNPEALVFGPPEVAEKLANIPVQRVYHGDHYEVQGFELDFYGYLHQEIHSSIPVIENVGVMVNQTLFYPGDSYTIPDSNVAVLACPASAPWLKISDVMDFLSAVGASKVFPTHNALLSEQGHGLYNARIKEVTEKAGGDFHYLEVGQSLTA